MLTFFVLPYQHVGESASGAVRTCLASNAIVITSYIPQFEDFQDEVVKIKNLNKTSISNQIMALLKNPELTKEKLYNAQKVVDQISYDRLSLKTLKLLQ
ncbi:MAG: hypothetical protein KatS3mg085_074 [Candidatus Dojkabacteria bacterium]|nr:MAG: hypothetical protein KatS3mg085_074 [Candidatus Dojkabacteria bacterium]